MQATIMRIRPIARPLLVRPERRSAPALIRHTQDSSSTAPHAERSLAQSSLFSPRGSGRPSPQAERAVPSHRIHGVRDVSSQMSSASLLWGETSARHVSVSFLGCFALCLASCLHPASVVGTSPSKGSAARAPATLCAIVGSLFVGRGSSFHEVGDRSSSIAPLIVRHCISAHASVQALKLHALPVAGHAWFAERVGPCFAEALACLRTQLWYIDGLACCDALRGHVGIVHVGAGPSLSPMVWSHWFLACASLVQPPSPFGACVGAFSYRPAASRVLPQPSNSWLAKFAPGPTLEQLFWCCRTGGACAQLCCISLYRL